MIWTLWQVTAPHLCAGLVTEDDEVIAAAPILKWAIGKSREELRGYFREQGWGVRRVPMGEDRR